MPAVLYRTSGICALQHMAEVVEMQHFLHRCPRPASVMPLIQLPPFWGVFKFNLFFFSFFFKLIMLLLLNLRTIHVLIFLLYQIT